MVKVFTKILNKIKKELVVAFLYEHDINNIEYTYVPKVKGKFIIIDNSNYNKFDSYFPEKWRETFQARIIGQNDKMVAYLINDEFAYWCFISFNNKYYEPAIDYLITIDVTKGYLYHTETLEKYQKNGIHAAGLVEALKLIKRYGKEKALMLVLKINLPALIALEKFRFNKIMTIYFIPKLKLKYIINK